MTGAASPCTVAARAHGALAHLHAPGGSADMLWATQPVLPHAICQANSAAFAIFVIKICCPACTKAHVASMLGLKRSSLAVAWGTDSCHLPAIWELFVEHEHHNAVRTAAASIHCCGSNSSVAEAVLHDRHQLGLTADRCLMRVGQIHASDLVLLHLSSAQEFHSHKSYWQNSRCSQSTIRFALREPSQDGL